MLRDNGGSDDGGAGDDDNEDDHHQPGASSPAPHGSCHVHVAVGCCWDRTTAHQPAAQDRQGRRTNADDGLALAQGLFPGPVIVVVVVAHEQRVGQLASGADKGVAADDAAVQLGALPVPAGSEPLGGKGRKGRRPQVGIAQTASPTMVEHPAAHARQSTHPAPTRLLSSAGKQIAPGQWEYPHATQLKRGLDRDCASCL